MELTCLNCAGTFELDNAAVAAGVVRCPVCGQQQPLAHRDPGGRPRRDAAGVPPRADTVRMDAGARSDTVRMDAGGRADPAGFRKPMQAFSTFRPAPGTAPGTAPSAAPPGAGTAEPPRAEPPKPRLTPFGGIPKLPETPPEPIRTDSRTDIGVPPPQAAAQSADATSSAAAPDAAAGATAPDMTWLVKSPTGLVLAFPTSQLLVNWSTILDNPAPYQVARGGAGWTSLEEFVREVKQGSRATQAFRRISGDAGRATSLGTESAPPAQEARRTPADGHPAAPAGERRVSTTAQFQFKLTRVAPQRGRKLLIAGILLAVAVVGAGLAVLALRMLG